MRDVDRDWLLTVLNSCFLNRKMIRVKRCVMYCDSIVGYDIKIKHRKTQFFTVWMSYFLVDRWDGADSNAHISEDGIQLNRGKLRTRNVQNVEKCNTEKYRIYKKDEQAGWFNVTYMDNGRRELTADLFKSGYGLFSLTYDKDGHISDRQVMMWLVERITPPYRIGIEKLLSRIGTDIYDELMVLKYTNGKSIHDDYWIDFNNPVGL